MRGSCPKRWSRVLSSLILISASGWVPFAPSSDSDSLLDGPFRNDPIRSVVQTCAANPVAAIPDGWAVVGNGSGNGIDAFKDRLSVFSRFLSPEADAPHHRRNARPDLRPTPPLRC